MENLHFFVERDFIDWIRDVIFCLENVQQTRIRTIAAIDDIASQINGVDDGNFNALVNSYKNNVEEIDFKKVKTRNYQRLNSVAHKLQ